jgi:putative phage-type endonuclease
MKTSRVKQRTTRWYDMRKGQIGGTRFGAVISNRKNKLLYELLNERLSDYSVEDTFINDQMQFGLDNEPYARKAYIKKSGIRFSQVGLIYSDFSKIHHASPDGINRRMGLVLEVKCTQDGSKQIQRFFDGIEPEYMPQIINYFAVSDSIKSVHWVSYCPMRTERPMVIHIVNREDHLLEIEVGRKKILDIEKQLEEMEQKFKF